METRPNSLAAGFLKKYRHGEGGGGEGGGEALRFVELDFGLLRLEYDVDETPPAPPALFVVSFVLSRDDDEPAIGRRLEFRVPPPPPPRSGDVVTYIGVNAVSGLQWSCGRVIWGHTYDDDSPAAEGREVDLDTWVDECIAEIINPSQELLDKYEG